MPCSITEIKRTAAADETHKEFVIGENEIYQTGWETLEVAEKSSSVATAI